ncbi:MULTISPECIES: EAL domain-containing protein [Mesobacillus]|uniref:bifunctional diguanylate cyclase/phosphodiesterase n=1 Tax=Mesobacillus TaxID=2675231 RepID=UPI0017809199|nr:MULTISPECIES: EAL domain-containing protein [Mesobacillus]MCM3574575.1 EAL domain-containing protein [Mesobacillus subterraneus]UYZ22640.1 EAL domain-containing protein [Mesobacillus jeotgali]
MQPDLNSRSLFDVYKSLFNFNHDGCFALDVQGNFIAFNEEAAVITGYSEEEALEMNFITMIHDEFVDDAIQQFKHVTSGGRIKFETAIFKKGTDERIELLITAVPITVGKEILGIVGCAQDFTEKKELEALLSGQNTILKMMAKGASYQEVLDEVVLFIESFTDGAQCSILIADQEGKRLLHGSSPNLPPVYNEAVHGMPIGPTAGSCGTAAFLRKSVVATDIAADPLWEEYRSLALSYDLKACWSSPVFDDDQRVIGTFGLYYCHTRSPREKDRKIIQQATDLASLVIQHYRAKEKINFMAYHDALTGLANRRLFDERVETAFTGTKVDEGEKLCLMFLDLDRFKYVNDSLGHSIGDTLLVYVSDKLSKSLGDGVFFSRQGGDEFTILLEHTTKEKAEAVARNILKTLEEPFVIDGTDIFITTSIGMSFYPDDGEKVDMLLSKADVAMYQAKKQGRNNYQIYDVMLDRKALEKLQIENELRKALDRDEFVLHYQPIVNLCSNEIKGAEALIRWQNDRIGFVSPDQFIPIAEETGLIIPIGEWVLKTALLQLKQWHADGLKELTVSVNLSIRQFYQPNLIAMVKETLELTGVEPRFLTIEITESMTMDVEAASVILQELKKLGVNISIDDFGTGYSSLSYLKRFPIDHLKIDRCFVEDIADNKSDENIATTIILMAHNLGLSVIAEGVETERQLGLLKQHHCNEAQGYHFSKPVSGEEFSKIKVPS